MIALIALLLAVQTAPDDGVVEFGRLKAMVGEWEGRTQTGRRLRASYRLIANGTVLIETWTSSGERQTQTVYFMDGAALLATHYCAQGNQPTLAWRPASGTEEARFVFRSATNLPDPAASHQVAFSIRMLDPDHVWRSETYEAAGVAEAEEAQMTRVRP